MQVAAGLVDLPDVGRLFAKDEVIDEELPPFCANVTEGLAHQFAVGVGPIGIVAAILQIDVIVWIVVRKLEQSAPCALLFAAGTEEDAIGNRVEPAVHVVFVSELWKVAYHLEPCFLLQLLYLLTVAMRQEGDTPG